MPCDAYTVLMLHCNGTDASTSFPDASASNHTVTAVGNAQVDTAQSKFGGASALFDGSGDRLTLADSADWDFGTGAFTIDGWIRHNSVATDGQMIWDNGGGGVAGVRLQYRSTPKFQFTFKNVDHEYNVSQSNSTWYHIACVRDSSTNIYFFVDGTQISTTTTDNSDLSGLTLGFWIGDNIPSAATPFNGWQDEVRVSKGIARWTAGFTPESSEYCAGGVSKSSMMSLMGIT